MTSIKILFASLLVCIALVSGSTMPRMVPVHIVAPTGYSLLKKSNASSLYQFTLPSNSSHPYEYAPYLLKLTGSRFQIGYDYASLLAQETNFTLHTFLNAVSKNKEDQVKFTDFAEYLWNSFYYKYIPSIYMQELEGMEAWWNDQPSHPTDMFPPHKVSKLFFVLANMPADTPNIIAALEDEFEQGWPEWLKDLVNDIIAILEKMGHHCDSYGVWGSRTVMGKLYTSRNLDYNSDTGINRYKLITIFQITEASGEKRVPYATMGFSFGVGALAGQSLSGITTSEMNLDNSKTTFSGLPFPLRLRYILEHATNLQTAMTLWNSTNNTNSFNFMIGSAADGESYALETIRHYTGVFPANSPIERAATYNCGVPPNVDPTCQGWTDQTGEVQIGFPMPEAVWRTNHGMNPTVMATQEPLFNGTVRRYNIMRDLFNEFAAANISIGDAEAVGIVATLGTKGNSHFTCDQDLSNGDNVLSVAYVPGDGKFFVAWEDRSGSAWRPAACAPYVTVNITWIVESL